MNHPTCLGPGRDVLQSIVGKIVGKIMCLPFLDIFYNF